MLGPSTIDETRFQYFRPTTTSQANTPGAAIDVLGAFQGGGNPMAGAPRRAEQLRPCRTSRPGLRSAHASRRTRLRTTTQTNSAPQNYTGTFTFSGGVAPVIDDNGNVIAGLTNIILIESYRRTLYLPATRLFSAARIRELGRAEPRSLRRTPATHSFQETRPTLASSSQKTGVSARTLSLNISACVWRRKTDIGLRASIGPRIGVAAGRPAARARSRRP